MLLKPDSSSAVYVTVKEGKSGKSKSTTAYGTWQEIATKVFGSIGAEVPTDKKKSRRNAAA